MNTEDEDRIIRALEIAQNGTIDGAHHKMWVIDQMVRALTGCPMVQISGIDCNGNSYTGEIQGESAAYLAWVKKLVDGEYEWDVGITP